MRPPNISVPNCENIFKFIEINTNSTLRELLKLPMRTNLDIIDIDSYMLRLSAPAIAASLTHIFNLSLYHGSLPSDWKIARITAIYKQKGCKDDPNNYRPISVVSSIAKIMENLVKHQLMSHFANNNLISSSQFAYLNKHSTQTAVHRVIDECQQYR